MFSSLSPFLPDSRFLKEVLQRKRYERIKQKDEQGFSRQWFLLAGRVDASARLQPRPASLQKLMPPNDRIWADPFLWKQGENLFLFCEEWICARPHGHISVMQLAGDGTQKSRTTPVLVENYHLSYPFLFEFEGALHMMPEGGANKAIDVYRCEEFPNRWRKRTTLMRNISYADATLFKHQEKWWLFTTIKKGLCGLNRDLFVFSADSPLTDKWTPHPRNPVVRNISGARPAGPLFEHEGKIFRPSQNCLVRYGHCLNINEVTRLDMRRYEERTVNEVKPDWQEGIRAIHHLDWRDDVIVMDTQRLLPTNDVVTSPPDIPSQSQTHR